MTTSLAFCFASRRASTFILDCVAVGSIAEDFSRSLPKLGSVIPPYNAQADRHAIGYFSSKPVPTVLRRTGQVRGGGGGHRVIDDWADGYKWSQWGSRWMAAFDVSKAIVYLSTILEERPSFTKCRCDT
uniref:Uncharacterized protein n=1 Tax=Erpetoichthys calabaricus TaxID=27687 RepID=A0A8C4RPI7_ERPCA